MARVTHERDLRSLDRPGLRKAFAPLDAQERLPRELSLEGGLAARGIGRRFIALAWPLALLAGLALLGWAAKAH